MITFQRYPRTVRDFTHSSLVHRTKQCFPGLLLGFVLTVVPARFTLHRTIRKAICGKHPLKVRSQMEVVECQFFRMLVSCACKFQINPWQPFLYTVNVVRHNSLWVDLKYIFKFGKHRYIDDMVNNFSKFNRPLFTSVLAALFHVN